MTEGKPVLAEEAIKSKTGETCGVAEEKYAIEGAVPMQLSPENREATKIQFIVKKAASTSVYQSAEERKEEVKMEHGKEPVKFKITDIGIELKTKKNSGVALALGAKDIDWCRGLDGTGAALVPPTTGTRKILSACVPHFKMEQPTRVALLCSASRTNNSRSTSTAWDRYFVFVARAKALLAGVLVVCGLTPVARASADVWSAVTPMAEPRATATATLLKDGEVLVAGGYNGFTEHVGGGTIWQPLAELFDPGTLSWRPTAPMQPKSTNRQRNAGQ